MKPETFNPNELYELISLCGERFSYLVLEEGEWIAVADRGMWRDDLIGFCEAGCCGQYKALNPVEAVKALLLDDKLVEPCQHSNRK